MNATIAKNRLGIFAAVLLALAVVAVVVFGAVTRPQSVVIPVTGGVSISSAQRANQAYTMRLNAMTGEILAAPSRSSTVWTERMNKQAAAYDGMEARARDAYAARYSKQAGVNTGMSMRSISTYSARLNALAKFYQTLK
jgi:hypothetical protein